MGYHRAGYDVVGVDINPQPHYPFEFHQGDALEYPLEGFDAIHASPPCQKHTKATLSQRNSGKVYPDLIDPIRERLRLAGVPYVIENVMGAPLTNAVMLCGSMFGLRVWRHRLFESTIKNWPQLRPCNHTGVGVPVVGHGTPSWVRKMNGGKGFSISEMRSAMGIDWMNRTELSQAIPPAYTEFIGKVLLEEGLTYGRTDQTYRANGGHIDFVAGAVSELAHQPTRSTEVIGDVDCGF